MFGFSFGKVLLLAVVIAGVWYGWRWLQRVQAVSRDEELKQAQDRARTIGGEDMVKCPACETYLSPRTARACGRAACPYPG